MVNIARTFLFCLLISGFFSNGRSQEIKRIEPVWWFGGAVGANFNFYSGSFSHLNTSTAVLNPFENGSGAGLFISPLLEYRFNPVWGGILFFGFDGRGGSFDDVKDSTVTHSLSASVNYLTLEPSVRIAPFGYPLYFFAGPRLGFNVAKSFELSKSNGDKIENNFSDVRGTVIGGQMGAGYEFALTRPESERQVVASPFLALHFGQGPRSEEEWGLTTLRAGVAVKLGNTAGIISKVQRDVQFSVRAPRIIPKERKVQETFPMRNYIFFDKGSEAIPDRYIRLTGNEAGSFREEQLLQPEPKDLTGRSLRQMKVYHHTLNIIGDRMRRNPAASITLLGSSEEGPAAGEELAVSVRRYLTSTFGIGENRIETRGQTKPSIPSLLAGATREIELVTPEDRRVEISASSPDLLDPVQIISLQEDPLDSDVLFTVSNAEDYFASWDVVLKDENGKTARYGPYTAAQERISGKSILGEKLKGQYEVELEGRTTDGRIVKKEASMKLILSDEPEEVPGYRFSILFEFDQSKTVSTYERFLNLTVVPLIKDGSSVIIHGHTDIVGEESHNLKLSQNRARETMNIIEQRVAQAGKRRVSFDTYGFGEDLRRAPFGNGLPEERFYNRTVIIDIIPE